MTDETWTRAARLDELRGVGPHAASANGVDLVVVRAPSGLKVYDGRCPHQGALLGEGELEGGALVCRNHRWRFDVETGQRAGGAACLRACPAREQDGELLVDVSALQRDRAAKAEAPRRLRALEDLPGPRGYPVLGNLLDIDVEHLHEVYEGWVREHGSMFAVNIGPRRLLFLSDPALIETILRARPDTYRRVRVVERVFAEMGASGVFSAEGAEWRPQRRLAMEALSHQHLRSFYPALESVTRRLLRRWRIAADAGTVLDVADELKRFTVDVTMRLVFGYDVNTLEATTEDVVQRHLEHFFPSMARRLNAVIPYWRYVKLPADRQLDRALAEMRTWLDGLIAQARTRVAARPQGAAPENFLEAMLTAKDDEGRPFSNEALFGNALTMLLAGEDTTAYTLAWAVHHLADSTRATAALRKEVDAVLEDAEVPVTIEQSGRLAYATAVANETMRLRPVAPLFFMEPNEDVTLGDVHVPKGTPIQLVLRPPMLDEKHFEQPRAFLPERFMGGMEGKAHDTSVHVPFGTGPRICPGRSLALVEMRVVLATLYKSFDVERVGKSADVKERFAFTMTPVGLRVRLRRRSGVE